MSTVYKPWERRLKDLAQLLFNCAETYFDPDLFRQNTNQFLQTSRTVTFIIQKNKASIADFDKWYSQHVVGAWQNDPIMQWAKDSRNVIEKEGDLELHSTLSATLIFSYLTEEDVIVRVGRAELLRAGVKKLVRLAHRQLPTGMADAAILRIERQWVSASLPNSELLGAMVSVYSRIEACCQNLTRHLQQDYPMDIQRAEDLSNLSDAARRVHYVKLRHRSVGSFSVDRIYRDPNFSPLPQMRDAAVRLRGMVRSISNLESAVGFVEIMAEETFKAFANHAPMLFLFDEHWKLASSVTTEFFDQADKYIFWRKVAEQITTQRIAGLVCVGEFWIRDPRSYPEQPIRKLRITGEILQVIGVDRAGALLQKTWRIVRSLGPEKPVLEDVDSENPMLDSVPFYLVPPMRAMGIEDPLSKKPKAFVRKIE